MAIFEENNKEFNASMGEGIQVTPLDVIELQDIRKGYDETIYASAGEAVRSQVKAINQRATNIERTVSGISRDVDDTKSTVSSMGERVSWLVENIDSMVDDFVVTSETTWSSQRIVDRLCPSFREKGSVVACNPIEVYPLEVITHIPETDDGTVSLTLCHTEKNLCDPLEYIKDKNGTVSVDGDVFTVTFPNSAKTLNCNYVPGYTETLPAGTYTVTFVPVSEGACASINVYAFANNAVVGSCMNMRKGGQLSFTFTAKETCYVCIVGPASAYYGTHSFKLQIEVGQQATAYEPFKGALKTVNFGTPIYGGTYNWGTGLLIDDVGQEHQFEPQEIKGVVGENCIYSSLGRFSNVFGSYGDTEVIGKADPVAMIENLTNAIISLGGNV